MEREGRDWGAVKGEKLTRGRKRKRLYIRVGCWLKKTKEGRGRDFSCCMKHGMPFGSSHRVPFLSDFDLPKIPLWYLDFHRFGIIARTAHADLMIDVSKRLPTLLDRVRVSKGLTAIYDKNYMFGNFYK